MPVNPTSAAKMPITTSAAIADITGNQARLRSDRNTDHEILPSSHEFLIRCMRRSIARAVGRLGPPRVSCRRRSAHALHLVEQCVLPALVLVRGDVTLVAQLGELLDLGRQARSTTAAGLVTQRLGHGLADRAGACARVGRPAGLHLPVDLLLHAVGMADVGELRRALLTGRLHVEGARADDPLPDALVEVDVVDPLERDLDAVPREEPGPPDHAVTRHEEVGARPLQELEQQPYGPDQCERADRAAGDVLARARVEPCVQDDQDEERDAGEDVAREVPPVRPQVERDRLTLVDQVLRVAHARGDYAGPRTRSRYAFAKRPSGSSLARTARKRSHSG